MKRLLVATTLLLTASCTTAPVDDSIVAEGVETKTISVVVSTAQEQEQQTRISIQEDEQSGDLTLLWSEGDELGGWSSSASTFSLFEMVSGSLSSSGSSATFSGAINQSDDSFRLLHPYIEQAAINNGIYSLDLGQQSADLSKDEFYSVGNSIYMISSLHDASESSQQQDLYLKHIGALIQLNLRFENLPSGEATISSVEVKGSDPSTIIQSADLDLSAEVSSSDFITNPTSGSLKLSVENSPILSSYDQSSTSYTLKLSALPFTFGQDESLEITVVLAVGTTRYTKRFTVENTSGEAYEVERASYITLNKECDMQSASITYEQSSEAATYDWEELTYEQVDFDAVYGECSGSTLVANIKTAINKLADNQIIIFNSEYYDFEFISMPFEKTARISGRIPSEIDGTVAGAQNIYTTFDNMYYFNLKKSNTQIYNIEMIGKEDESGMIKISDGANSLEVVDPDDVRHDIKLSNLCLRNNYASIAGGNGCGLDVQYCSFKDYTRAGFLINRKGICDESPRITFKYSTFDSYLSDYDCRGISFDSGNTEYPIVLDLNQTLIENCYFYKTGVSFSKSGNATIQNCHFVSNTMYMDMIHVEEYGNRITIDNNIFEHESPSRGIYLDRERQCVDNITITNNTFIGEVGWVISAYSPSNLTFENNDFTQASFATTTSFPYDFDFSYYKNEEEKSGIAYEIPMHNLIFRNNPGLDFSGGMRIFTEQDNNTNIIDISGGEVTEVPAVVSPIDDDSYYFKNVATGQYISFDSNDDYLSVSDSANDDCVWGVQFMAPQNYAITTTSGQYMEAYIVYTLSNMENNTSPGDTKLRKSTYPASDERTVPTFVMQHPDDSSYSDYYIIYPGCNERKSAVGIIDGAVDMRYGSIVRESPADYTDCLWILKKSSDITIDVTIDDATSSSVARR